MNSTDTWFTPVLYRVSDNCRTIHDYDAPFILVVQDDDEDRKSCFKSAKNRVCYSLSHMYTYIGTPKFLINPLWV